ncbi:Ionotropic receptor 217 [Blattella germanica]|nr:Ionotropic receptor 217 [Blattella germanica]
MKIISTFLIFIIIYNQCLFLAMHENVLLTDEQRHLVHCLMNVALNYFTPNQPIAFSITKKEDSDVMENPYFDILSNSIDGDIANYILKSLHAALQWQIRMSYLVDDPLELPFDGKEKIESYILLAPSGDLEDMALGLGEQLNALKASTTWNPRAKYVIIVTSHLQSELEDAALTILKDLWLFYKILNVVSIFPRTELISTVAMTTSFDFYTWFPYQSNVKCANTEDVIVIETWILKGEGYFLKNSTLFPNKITKNLQGCLFRVSSFELVALVNIDIFIDENGIAHKEYSGFEVKVVKEVAETLNLSLLFLDVDGIGVQTRVNALGDLESGKTDITFGAFPLHEQVFPFADPVVSYFDDIMNWYVPCGRPVPRMQKVMEIFTLSVWLTLGISITISAIVMNFEAKLTEKCKTKESSGYMQMKNSVLNVWAVVMGVSVTEMPRTHRLRLYFFILIWYCFAMSTLFQTFFTSYLVNPGIMERIRTLEQLYESDLEYRFFPENENYLKFSFPTYYSRIPLKRKLCNLSEVCLYELISSKDFTVIGHSFHTEYFTSSNNNPKLCTLDDNIYKLSFTMHLAKGSPLIEVFDDVVRRLIEGGLVGKWWLDVKTDYWVRLLPKDEFFFPLFLNFNSKEEEYVVLSLSHLQLAFYVLGVGCAIGLILLICETVHYRIFSRNPPKHGKKVKFRKVKVRQHKKCHRSINNYFIFQQ